MKPKTVSLVSFLPYTALIFFLVVISVAARGLLLRFPHVSSEINFQLFILGGIFFVGYFINRIAPKTIIPSFVWAMFAGMALQPLLSFFTGHISGLGIAMEIFAAIILFAGGLDIPFKQFKKFFFPIASLSLIGVMTSAIVFAFVLYGLVQLMGPASPALIPSIIVLSAALASSDPTAIIPTLKGIRFKNPALQQIAVAESALTDVTGSVLTQFLLLALITVDPNAPHTIISYFRPLLEWDAYQTLGLQVLSGMVVGFFAFLIMRRFYIGTKKVKENSSDPALLMSVPIITLALGNVFGGAGLLASFISGLLSDAVGGLHSAARFYDSFLNHLIKPFIFVVLGALVPINILLLFAPLGIISALAFMFLVRPFVVFVSLFPWFHKGTFGFKDFLFLSFVRETGIMAAVLLILAASTPVISSDFVIAIGMWVILLTLIIEPPVTPYLAMKIGIAEPMPPEHAST